MLKRDDTETYGSTCTYPFGAMILVFDAAGVFFFFNTFYAGGTLKKVLGTCLVCAGLVLDPKLIFCMFI